MGKDDDIASFLPRPPHPSPARREAAFDEALRRFDGGAPAPDPRIARSPNSWAAWFRRPYAGALVSAALIALIAVPVAWTSLDDYRSPRQAEPPAVARDASRAAPDADPKAAADAAQPQPTSTSAADAPAPQPPPASRSVASSKSGAEPIVPPSAPVRQVEGLVSAHDRAEQRAAAPVGSSAPTSDVLVSGARTARAKAAPPAPAAESQGYANAEEYSDESTIVVSGSRTRSAGRGDWNACTIDDPSRNLNACRRTVRRLPKAAATDVAEGLARAWDDDLQASIAAFDRAVAAAPRSAYAYLNRGLAYRRSGDLSRALADLDKAILYAPQDARGYYNRSLVLRARGETRRARADAIRAIELDGRYADVLE